MDQVTFWNGEGGERWVREQERLDAVIGPLGDVALAAARILPGERVLDVGCGCGGTTLALAKATGPGGEALGVDISAPMLERARARAQAAGLTSTSFQKMDAATFRPEKPFDLLFSRFGVMFFDDPAAAFANLAQALHPGGRLAFVCWRAIAENLWMTVPVLAAKSFVPPLEPTPPEAPGPFAFADGTRLTRILEGAGFTAVTLTPHDQPLRPGSLEDATDYAFLTGGTARLAATADDATRAKMRVAVTNALRPYVTARGVELASAVWIVTATRG